MKEKGSTWQLALDYLEETYDGQELDKVKASLTADDRLALFRRKISTLTWVDYFATTRFLLAADKLIGQDDQALMRSCAHYQAQQELDNVQKLIFKMKSPHYLIQKVSQVWKQNYSLGSASAEKAGPKESRFIVVDASSIPLHHEIMNSAWIEEAIRLTGGKQVKSIHETCMAKGDECCSTLFSWA